MKGVLIVEKMAKLTASLNQTHDFFHSYITRDFQAIYPLIGSYFLSLSSHLSFDWLSLYVTSLLLLMISRSELALNSTYFHISFNTNQ
jgi:hypothetical protein